MMEGEISSVPEAQSHAEPDLVRDDYIESVALEMQHADWYVNEAKEKFDDLGATIINDPDSRNQSGRFGEILTRVALEHAASNNPQIQLDPIQDGAITENYNFRYDRDGHLSVVDSKTGTDNTEYDHVFLVNSTEGTIPVIVEVKIQTNDRHEKSKRRLAHAVSGERMDRRLAPLRELFGTDKVGYILVANREFQDMNHPDIDSFVTRGGMLAFLPFEAHDISRLVEHSPELVAA